MILVPNRKDYLELLKTIDEELEDPNPALRALCQNDLYFLIRYEFGRMDFEHDWLFDRCREVQEDPDDHIDL